ncbi:MAG TPA: insulinase family protein [Saprospiraceae bacterium]|nr:insulinase family protein [Saprospiraceae bacterium]HMQ83224.1 insulinase family protein [Saprospiraceae bacterium]
MRKLWIVLFCCLAGRSFAQPHHLPIPSDTSVRIGQLDNGLTFYIGRANKPENRAALRLVLKAGSLQETEGQRGLAHFVEHMAFNGTESFEKNELIDYLERTGTRFGADLNAHTSFEETVYKLESRTDSLPLLETGIRILREWAGAVVFDSLEVEKERGVVLSEWRSRLSPDQRLQQQAFPVIYKNARFAERWPIGDTAVIQHAPPALIQAYYKRWYRPDLMAVVVTGDMDPDWVEAQIVRLFSDLVQPSAEAESVDDTVKLYGETRFAIFSDEEAPFTNVELQYFFPEAPFQTQQDYRASLGRSLLNRMLNARLVEIQLLPDPPFTFAYSGYGGDLGHLDAYSIHAFVKEGGAKAGFQAVLRETKRALLHGFTSSELERQKAEMLRNAEIAFLEREHIKADALASRYVYHFLEQVPTPDAAQQLDLYRQLLPQIQVEDLNTLLSQWLSVPDRVFVLTGPDGLPAKQDLLDWVAEIEAEEVAPYEDQVNDAPLFDKKLKPVAVRDSAYWPALGLQYYQLSNGVKVYLKPTDFQNDQILMQAFSPGGHSLSDEEAFFSAYSATTVIGQSGLGAFSLPELQKKLAGLNVSVSPYIEENYEGISGNCSPSELELMLQLTSLYFTQIRADSTALRSYINRQKSIFENITVNPYYYFADIKNKIKYQGHPRRQMLTLSDLDQIKLEDIEAFYRDRFSDASDFTFVLVGNFQVDSMLEKLATYLGNLPASGRRETWRDIGVDLIPSVDTTIQAGIAPKTLVELVYHGDFEKSSQNRYDFYAMIAVLRLKLRQSLREDLGGVYGVSVNGHIAATPASKYRITISFSCDPDRYDELIQTIYAEIAGLGSADLQEEVAKVKETQKQSYLKSLKENGFWLGQISSRLQDEDLTLEGILSENYFKYVDGLTVEAIQQAVVRYFDQDKKMLFVLAPK